MQMYNAVYDLNKLSGGAVWNLQGRPKPGGRANKVTLTHNLRTSGFLALHTSRATFTIESTKLFLSQFSVWKITDSCSHFTAEYK